MMPFTRFVHVCIATVIDFHINHFHESLLNGHLWIMGQVYLQVGESGNEPHLKLNIHSILWLFNF